MGEINKKFLKKAPVSRETISDVVTKKQTTRKVEARAAKKGKLQSVTFSAEALDIVEAKIKKLSTQLGASISFSKMVDIIIRQSG